MMSHHLLDLDKFNEIYDLEDDIFLNEYPWICLQEPE